MTSVTEQAGLELAFNPDQPRGPDGKWVPEFRFGHRPMETAAPVWDIDGSIAGHLPENVGTSYFPPDHYTHPQYYTYGDPRATAEGLAAERRVRGKPDAMVRIYRAAPAGTTRHLRKGDWVSLSRSYARKHADSRWSESGETGLPWEIHSVLVPARHVRDGGDGAYVEQGYWGPGTTAEIERDLSITDQAGVELSWKDAWLHEARDSHGRWTRGAGSTGKTYELPDPARLVSTRSPYKSPGDHPFFQAHPVSPQNIAAMFDSASDQQKAQGLRWYADAHELASAIDPDVKKAAGVIAAYSPQTAWQVNMFNAARALREKRALGKKDGMITGAMQKNAAKALAGGSLDEVLKSPKTNDFGHLIASGGDAPDEKLGRVVIDRHAMSVAVGHRLGSADMESAPIDDRRYYEHVADAYRQAAAALSKREGMTVSPHQLQAITWLRQQELNQASDRDAGGVDPKVRRLERGRETAQRNAWARWTNYDWQHNLPSEIGTTSFPGAGIAPEVRKSPEGFSISMGTGKAPSSGYMVAMNGHTHQFPATVMEDERKLADAIDAMLLAESDTFSHENIYLGGWVHDGKLWLEPSQNVQDRAAAGQLARSGDQIAIWDVTNGQEISTGGITGGSLITQHSGAEDDHGRARGLLLAAGIGAQAGGPGPGPPAPLGIAAQAGIDLSWKDAWRHELRAPDGRWVHGAEPSAYGHDLPEGWLASYPEHANTGIINEWRKATIPPVKFYLNQASGALSGDDPESAAQELQHAADAARANGGDEVVAERYELMARNIRKNVGQLVQLKTDVTAFSAKAAPVVPGLLGGGHESWNGQTTFFADEENPGVLAQLRWNGTMNVQETTARHLQDIISTKGTIQDPAPPVVILHELIHGVVGGREDETGLAPQHLRSEKFLDNQQAYQDQNKAAIEEGFTELGVIQHAPEFFDQMGIGKRPTEIVSQSGEVNPAHIRATKALTRDLQKQWASLVSDPRAPQMHAADRLGRLIENLKADPGNIMWMDDLGADEVLREIQHLGDSGLSAWAQKMRKRAAKIQATPYMKRDTMSEYARRLQDPKKIESGNAWGHYPTETSAAWQWVQAVADGEGEGRHLGGFTSYGPGSPGWNRAVELGDEINREGTAAKLDAMVRQVIRAAGADSLPPGELEKLKKDIADDWRKNSFSEIGAAIKFQNAKSEVMQMAMRYAS